ncbi:hypothetical protein SDC9_75857 [bioreactor metagenome]|uniref:Uncharacterized protein n=1 Tax=bioreactor metagenome TaxID=1076179 RepID=A0A644YLY0_9ZZZZ
MNPETYDFCHQCRFYEAVADYDYQLSSPGKRKCRHLNRCRRVEEIARSSYSGTQMAARFILQTEARSGIIAS